MAQKFSVILDNNILKKTVMEELGLDSFPATMNASIVQESNLMQLSVTADSPEHAYLILESVLRNYPTLSDYIIPNVVLQTLEQPQISGSPSNQLPVRQYMIYAFLGGGGGGGLDCSDLPSAGYRKKRTGIQSKKWTPIFLAPSIMRRRKREKVRC